MSDSALIIYQMGKVGSTTLHNVLEQADLPMPIYKVHFLSDAGLRHAVEFHQKTLKIPWETTPHIETTNFLRQKIKSDNNTQWKIISLVRDPIGREISEFFQYVHSLYPNLLDANGEIDAQKTMRILQTKFMFYNPQKNYTCRWFDMEVKNMFGIDVFAHPFDTEAGYSIIKQGNVDLLVMRLESLNENFTPAMNEFLGRPLALNHQQANVRSTQKRGATYHHIRQQFSLSDSVCRKVYHSAYARHFYSETQIDQFVQKWSGKASS